MLEALRARAHRPRHRAGAGHRPGHRARPAPRRGELVRRRPAPAAGRAASPTSTAASPSDHPYASIHGHARPGLPAGALAARLQRLQRPRWPASWGCPSPSPTTSPPATPSAALQVYRSAFQPSEVLEAPYVMLGVNVVCAETDERGPPAWPRPEPLAFLRLRQGRPGLYPSAGGGRRVRLHAVRARGRARLDRLPRRRRPGDRAGPARGPGRPDRGRRADADDDGPRHRRPHPLLRAGAPTRSRSPAPPPDAFWLEAGELFGARQRTELVALRIGEDDPARAVRPAPVVDRRGADAEQAIDFLSSRLRGSRSRCSRFLTDLASGTCSNSNGGRPVAEAHGRRRVTGHVLGIHPRPEHL